MRPFYTLYPRPWTLDPVLLHLVYLVHEVDFRRAGRLLLQHQLNGHKVVFNQADVVRLVAVHQLQRQRNLMKAGFSL